MNMHEPGDEGEGFAQPAFWEASDGFAQGPEVEIPEPSPASGSPPVACPVSGDRGCPGTVGGPRGRSHAAACSFTSHELGRGPEGSGSGPAREPRSRDSRPLALPPGGRKHKQAVRVKEGPTLCGEGSSRRSSSGSWRRGCGCACPGVPSGMMGLRAFPPGLGLRPEDRAHFLPQRTCLRDTVAPWMAVTSHQSF